MALLAGGALLLAAADQALRACRAIRRCHLVPAAERRRQGASRRVLVAGDSTGVGLGAGSPDRAIAGRLAAALPDLDIVNVSRVGARVADVPAQLASPEAAGRFDLVLLHVGGNDILQGTRSASLLDDTRRMLRGLQAVAPRRVWLGPADVGIAPVWRLPLRLWMSRRSRSACRTFERLARSHAIEFIGFHGAEHSAEFGRHRQRYFAEDGIHPSAEAYRYCYDRLTASGGFRELFDATFDAASPPASTPRGRPAVVHGWRTRPGKAARASA